MNGSKSALVALVGVPNVGKSSLINALVGEKLGIVSPKPNTTRVVVRGVLTQGAHQLILMDTPGLNRSSKSFDRRLVQQATGALNEADIVVILCETKGLRSGDDGAVASRWPQEKDWAVAAKNRKQKVVVCLTKIDLLKDKKALLPVMTELGSWGVDAVVPLSAMKKDAGIGALVAELVRLAPEGPWLFPAGQVTDMPLPLRLAEITREKAMRLLDQEVPYGVGVVTEAISGLETASYGHQDVNSADTDGEGEEEGPVLVQQQLLIAREQHKPIVLGKGGAMLKEIGTQARKEMQSILGRGVRLELHVKVAERWLEREDWLREMGV